MFVKQHRSLFGYVLGATLYLFKDRQVYRLSVSAGGKVWKEHLDYKSRAEVERLAAKRLNELMNPDDKNLEVRIELQLEDESWVDKGGCHYHVVTVCKIVFTN